MATIKLSLNIQDLTDEFFEGARLLGIMTSQKDYRFCWTINNLLGLNFRVNNELEIKLRRKTRDYYFPVYEYSENTTVLCHYLYNNQNDGEYLLPVFKNFDFLWLLKNDDIQEAYIDELKNWIRDLPNVQLVTEMDLQNVKNRENLIF